ADDRRSPERHREGRAAVEDDEGAGRAHPQLGVRPRRPGVAARDRTIASRSALSPRLSGDPRTESPIRGKDDDESEKSRFRGESGFVSGGWQPRPFDAFRCGSKRIAVQLPPELPPVSGVRALSPGLGGRYPDRVFVLLSARPGLSLAGKEPT